MVILMCTVQAQINFAVCGTWKSEIAPLLWPRKGEGGGTKF